MFLRSLEDYLSPWPKRDVIETPLDGVLDVNRWDFHKALTLLLKGNAVILEWVQSPVQYTVDPWFKTSFLELAAEVAGRPLIVRHYRHTAERQRELHLADPETVLTKKLFYVLRPVLALRWMLQRPTASVPPMHFEALVGETELPTDLAELLHELIAEKAQAGEKSRRPAPAALITFIESELDAWQDSDEMMAEPAIPEDHKRLATAFLRASIERLAPT